VKDSLCIGAEMKAAGNTAFAQDRTRAIDMYSEAIDAFSKAIRIYKDLLKRSLGEVEKEVRMQLAIYYSNRAAARLTGGIDLTKVLEDSQRR
jgi:hypothetical protein